MGRKSSLTEKQWEAIEKRALNGDPVRALAREFEISEAAIRKRIGARTKTIKDVANQLVVAERAFESLPLGAQISARTLADRLKAISNHLAGAAEYGSSTAHRLAALANAQMDRIDESKPFDKDSVEAIKGIAVLTETANRAAEIPLNLLKANKETIADLSKNEAMQQAGLSKASQKLSDDPMEASKEYQRIMGVV